MAATILIVDDSKAVLELASSALQRAGYRVVTTTNPIETATLLRQECPDLVLMDVGMPGLGGGQIVSTLQRFDFAAGCQLVFFSGLESEALEKLVEDCGAHGFIRKASPFDPVRLVRQVRSHLIERPALTRGRAMVIDDSRAMRRLLSRILSSLGYDVETAVHGKEALAQLEASSEPVRVALVDLHMPEMNGLEFVIECRGREPALARMPIVLVTSETDMDQVRRVLEAGADEVILKPFDQQAIVEKLRLLGMAS
ncbi:MAG: response regulator [Planctomycetes bacterium]|nr:response regulator [Planctomycetota bacterium]